MENLSYYASVKSVAKINDFKNEFELWLNSNLDFILLWENIYNDKKYSYTQQKYITIDDWARLDSKSLLVNPDDKDDYLIHPHILMAFSIEDPVVKINLIGGLFNLDESILSNFLLEIFGIDSNEEDELDKLKSDDTKD